MKSGNRDLALRMVAILLIVAFAGPEMGLGLEALALLDILGAELFFLSFYIGFRSIPFSIVTGPARRWLERHDPYFFIPTISQIKSCPGVISHAMPGLIAIYFAILACGVM